MTFLLKTTNHNSRQNSTKFQNYFQNTQEQGFQENLSNSFDSNHFNYGNNNANS